MLRCIEAVRADVRRKMGPSHRQSGPLSPRRWRSKSLWSATQNAPDNNLQAVCLSPELTILQRWRWQLANDEDGLDGRKGSHRQVRHRLSEKEHKRILLTCNQPYYASLPPRQSYKPLLIRGSTSGRKTAIKAYSMLTPNCIGMAEHRHHKNQEQ